MKRRIKWAAGQIIKISSIVVGLYLIVITFGWEPLYSIIEIVKTKSGLLLIGKVALQLLKMMFGIGYSMIGMAILYRTGNHLVEKNKNW